MCACLPFPSRNVLYFGLYVVAAGGRLLSDSFDVGTLPTAGEQKVFQASRNALSNTPQHARHSVRVFVMICRHSMLMNGVSVERSDLAPTPGLVMHGSGDEAPALWRLYARAPYVIQNGLACDIVVWASQPEAETDSSMDAALASPGGAAGVSPPPGKAVKRRLRLKSFG